MSLAKTRDRAASVPNDLDAYWVPFTPNRAFKRAPRIVVGAKDMHYFTSDGRTVLDGAAGMWCCNAGHNRDPIIAAIQQQAAELDYAAAFQFSHPKAFELASRLVALAPPHLAHVFFCNSGSEAVDTALKIALAYHNLRGQGSRTRLIGREKGYHGVNFGGISVGGIVGNRKTFGQAVEADHLPHTLSATSAYSRGQPASNNGVALADRLLELIQLHDATNIAAVIVEPMSGSAGVVVPPVGYLERLREICTTHDILLIFDEVITGFGRMGANTGSEYFGVTPDILNAAKQITNGAQPLGVVVAKQEIYDTFIAAGGPDYMLEFPHGYTYSAHPIACAAGIATLDVMRKEGLIARVAELAPYFENAVHSLKGAKIVTDIRNIGLAAGLTIAAAPGEPAKRPYEIAMRCWQKGFYVRYGGDTIQLAPPFIATEREIDDLINVLGEAITATA